MKKLILTLPIALILLVLTIISPACEKSSSLARLTILHTNDTHASLDDIGRRATVVQQVRSEKGQDNVLLVDSGDVFNGTLYFTVAQGQDDLWFMNKIGYEAMTLGNHEFDKGPAVLANFVNQADFPVICANFDFSKEEALAGKISPWIIVQKGGEKYGLLGLTTEDTAESSSPGGKIVINQVIPAAQKAVADLQGKGINKIIALTHIGWDKDLELARQVKGIDVIVGGYSHTVPEIYPMVIRDSGSPTLVVQAGAQGKYLGQINVSFDDEGVIKDWAGSRLIAIDNSINPDPEYTAKLTEFHKPVEEMLNTIVGRTNVDLDGDRSRVRSRETNLGDMLADAMVNKTASLGASIAILNAGAIRSSVPAGDVSLGQILQIASFGNYLTVMKLSGQQIAAALENGVSQVAQEGGRFPQVSGLRYTWDPQAATGGRIISVEVKTASGYQPIDSKASYSVVTIDFIAGGGDGYSVLQEASEVYNTGFVDFEEIRDYVKANSPLNPVVEGRIKRSGE